jgi:hypothetical protein
MATRIYPGTVTVTRDPSGANWGHQARVLSKRQVCVFVSRWASHPDRALAEVRGWMRRRGYVHPATHPDCHQESVASQP